MAKGNEFIGGVSRYYVGDSSLGQGFNSFEGFWREQKLLNKTEVIGKFVCIVRDEESDVAVGNVAQLANLVIVRAFSLPSRSSLKFHYPIPRQSHRLPVCLGPSL